MKLYAIFGILKGETEPVLLACFDEMDMEEEEVYQEKLSEFRDSDEISEVREVILNVPAKTIKDAFKVPVVEVT